MCDGEDAWGLSHLGRSRCENEKIHSYGSIVYLIETEKGLLIGSDDMDIICCT